MPGFPIRKSQTIPVIALSPQNHQVINQSQNRVIVMPHPQQQQHPAQPAQYFSHLPPIINGNPHSQIPLQPSSGAKITSPQV